MKKTITLTLVTLIALNLNAQSLLPKKYGVKIGANIANIHSEANTGAQNIKSSALIGVSGGFYMEIPLNDKWYINPELIYTQKGGSFTYNYQHDYQVNERDLHKTENELKLTYIELNPTVSYKANEKISLNFEIHDNNYSNGFMKHKINYNSGKEDGKWIQWYQNGKKELSINYVSSTFMILVLAKELMALGHSEEYAFKMIFKDFMLTGAKNSDWQIFFLDTFGFSVDDFYDVLQSYTLNLENVMPSSSLSLQQIFD